MFPKVTLCLGNRFVQAVFTLLLDLPGLADDAINEGPPSCSWPSAGNILRHQHRVFT